DEIDKLMEYTTQKYPQLSQYINEVYEKSKLSVLGDKLYIHDKIFHHFFKKVQHRKMGLAVKLHQVLVYPEKVAFPTVPIADTETESKGDHRPTPKFKIPKLLPSDLHQSSSHTNDNSSKRGRSETPAPKSSEPTKKKQKLNKPIIR